MYTLEAFRSNAFSGKRIYGLRPGHGIRTHSVLSFFFLCALWQDPIQHYTIELLFFFEKKNMES